MILSAMLRVKMAWARPTGPRHEVVLSSRLRLARNLKGRSFPPRARHDDLAAVLKSVFAAAAAAPALAKAARVRLDEVDAVDREFMVERRLASRALVREPQARGVVVGEREVLSVMVNEEDHLRIQGIDSGLCLEDLLSQVSAADDQLSASLDLAFSPAWGYSTACPTNVGTGLRASALVHLPGLALSGQVNGVLQRLGAAGMIARGHYGEGTKVLGDFYQVANARSLGVSEAEIVEAVGAAVESLVRAESKARTELLHGLGKTRLEDLVYRSMGALAHARLVTYEEAMQHLSYARLGLSLGWELPADLTTVNELTVLSQPGHVQMLAGKELKGADRDFLRATLLRGKLKS
ncbi:MAG: ATP--guanido phosphotransferase [Elusimicrobia bacterium]|nr:ATP--guanido phosphotransferase [Elusimicrobiota bacterium]